MSVVWDLVRRAAYRHRCRHARLPWRELEAEAARQGCSAADIFFDRSGRGAHAAPETHDQAPSGQ